MYFDRDKNRIFISEGEHMKRTLRYFAILVLILALWNTPIIKPLKLFTVFLHELGHSLVALIFGGGISSINISLNESGYAVTQASSWLANFFISNGGYLGSLFFALLILYLRRTSIKHYILGFISIIFLFVAIRFSGFSFTLVYSSLFVAFALVIYMIQSETVDEWVIDIIGIASVSYAIYDVFVDTIMLQINTSLGLIRGWSGAPRTDAQALAQLTGIPAVLWGVIWLAIMLLTINFVLIKAPGVSGYKKGRRY